MNVVLKADVQGSVQAISESLTMLSTDEVKVNIVGSGVGGITETDASLAAASAVPPVAIKSSITSTLSFSFNESLCTSIVAVPYSSSKSIE